MKSPLKLYGTSNDDLAVISALFQDAALAVGDMASLPEERRFVLMANRFIWEKRRWFRKPKGERVRSALHFNGVLNVKFQGIDLSDKQTVLALLAIESAADSSIMLTFSGSAAIKLEVECIDFVASDLGESWDALARPRHDHI